MNYLGRGNTARQRGFSLVELMVTLVIGMIAAVVVMQVFQLSEGSRRTTTGGDDAQTNGAIALMTLQRDIRQAGYGLANFSIIGCNVALPAPATWTLAAMAPVTINHANIPAGDLNTDTLLVVYGNSEGSSEGDRVITQPPPAPAVYTVTTPTSFALNDLIIASPLSRPVPCNLTMEAVVEPPSSSNVSVAAGVPGMANGTLFNAGPAPRVLAYAVRGGALTVCDYLANDCGLAANVDEGAIWVPIGDNIVSLRADYGQDATVPMDNVVDGYDRTTPTTQCGWARVSAVRVALVARSAQAERADIPAKAASWAGAASAPIDLSANADWRRYRYRTFETTVPLRNMAWQGVPPC